MRKSRESRFPNSDTTMWNNDGPTVPAIIPFVFFLVLTITILLYLYKVLKKYYNKQVKSESYAFVDHDSDDTARLKKVTDDDDMANSLKLNSLKRTTDGRGGSTSVPDPGLVPNLIQVDEVSPSTPKGSVDFSDNVSGTETLPLNKKKVKPTESNV